MYALDTRMLAACREADHHDGSRRPLVPADTDRYLAMIESICDQAIRDGRSYLELVGTINRHEARTGRHRFATRLPSP